MLGSALSRTVGKCGEGTTTVKLNVAGDRHPWKMPTPPPRVERADFVSEQVASRASTLVL